MLIAPEFKLYSRQFAQLERARRRAMTEDRIITAIEAMPTNVQPAEPPSPARLPPRSRFQG